MTQIRAVHFWIGIISIALSPAQASQTPPPVMLQYFHSHLPADSTLWRTLRAETPSLAEKGFEYLWLPPAFKGFHGKRDNGYAVYDLYDLGEFDQRGTVPTKYGTAQEYLDAIASAQAAGMKVIADIVLNHRIGAEHTELVLARKVDPNHRHWLLSNPIRIEAWTYFGFPGRNGKHSSFVWDHRHFKGVDWDEREKIQGNIYLLQEPTAKKWNSRVSREKGNFDYLMGADVDFDSKEVRRELRDWGTWYTRLTHVDGFRFDGVKHIDYSFLPRWMNSMEHRNQRDYWAVGEYLEGDVSKLRKYLRKIRHRFAVFDVPLHYRIQDASLKKGAFDLSKIFKGTLTEKEPRYAVQFVENHDTQPGQDAQSPVADWFKYHAYALLLLRNTGMPSVFYGDYYGVTGDFQKWINLLMEVRKASVSGKRHDYFDRPNLIGWTFEGNRTGKKAMAVVLGNSAVENSVCSKTMYVGRHGPREFREVSGRGLPPVHRRKNGMATFRGPCDGVSIWVGEK